MLSGRGKKKKSKSLSIDMRVFKTNPFNIQFADPVLYKYWYREMQSIDERLINNIKEKGIIDPIIAYRTEGNFRSETHLERLIRNNFLSFDPVFLFSAWWCWRGTQRLRIARFLDLPDIKVLYLDEEEGDLPHGEQIQQLFKKRINIFFNQVIKRWDIVSADCDDAKIVY